MSSLSLVAGQEVDQHQNAINIILTLVGGSLTLCCLCICAAKFCMRNECNQYMDLNNTPEEKAIEVNADEIIEAIDNDNGMNYIRMTD